MQHVIQKRLLGPEITYKTGTPHWKILPTPLRPKYRAPYFSVSSREVLRYIALRPRQSCF